MAEGDTGAAPIQLKYSLSRVQLAFWFFLILSAFLFVCTTTWEMHLIGPGLVGLLGVSGATALGSAAIDRTKTKEQPAVAELAAMEQQRALQNSGYQKRKAEPEDSEQILTEKAERRMKLGKTSSLLGFTSFFRDIMSGENGVEIHRLQNILWTGFLGIVFVRAVWNSLALPDLDANLVLLMLVSSSTYLGLKQQASK
jgi:hypothetical protein